MSTGGGKEEEGRDSLARRKMFVVGFGGILGQ